MDYDFGDIIDCRDYSIDHFILVLGVNRKNEVMYYQITSRTYKVFKNILLFFNDCIDEKYSRFFHFFSKEKGKGKIYQTGKLCDAFFLDENTNYSGHLEVDSMILINSEPEFMDKSALDNLHKNKLAKFRTRLADDDSRKIIQLVHLSKYISPYNKSEIGRNYNLWNKAHIKNNNKKTS